MFFSSHVLGQVELICDRIGVLHDGQLLAEGTLAELRAAVDVDAGEDATVEDVFVACTSESVVPETGGDRR